MALTVFLAAGGLMLAWAGYRLIKRFEPPWERTGFHTVDWRREFGYGGGYILLFLGLLTTAAIAPMYWISHSR